MDVAGLGSALEAELSAITEGALLVACGLEMAAESAFFSSSTTVGLIVLLAGFIAVSISSYFPAGFSYGPDDFVITGSTASSLEESGLAVDDGLETLGLCSTFFSSSGLATTACAVSGLVASGYTASDYLEAGLAASV